MSADNKLGKIAEDTQPVICRETGVAQYEGDVKVYEDIVKTFAKTNEETLERLYCAISAGDIGLAYRTAHSLRGAAGTIGAVRLASAALYAENTLAAMRGAVPDVTCDERLDRQMALLEQEFNAVFDELGRSSGDRDAISDAPGGMDRDKITGLIEKLAPLLESGDTKCLEYMNEIESAFRPVSDHFRLFITQMEYFDFEQASGTLNEIRLFLSHITRTDTQGRAK